MLGFSVVMFLITVPVIYNYIGHPFYIHHTTTALYGVAIVVFITMGLIVILHDRREKKMAEDSKSGESTSAPKTTSELQIHAPKWGYKKMFESVLSNDTAVKALEEFLMKELSVENLLFVKAINNLESSGMSDEEKITVGNNIYEKFVSPTAALEVNISSLCRLSLNSVFTERSIDLRTMTEALGQAKAEVTTLIVQDSLRRFYRTAEFQILGIESQV